MACSEIRARIQLLQNKRVFFPNEEQRGHSTRPYSLPRRYTLDTPPPSHFFATVFLSSSSSPFRVINFGINGVKAERERQTGNVLLRIRSHWGSGARSERTGRNSGVCLGHTRRKWRTLRWQKCKLKLPGERYFHFYFCTERAGERRNPLPQFLFRRLSLIATFCSLVKGITMSTF